MFTEEQKAKMQEWLDKNKPVKKKEVAPDFEKVRAKAKEMLEKYKKNN